MARGVQLSSETVAFVTVVASESFVYFLELFDRQVKTLEGIFVKIIFNYFLKGKNSPFSQVILLFFFFFLCGIFSSSCGPYCYKSGLQDSQQGA